MSSVRTDSSSFGFDCDSYAHPRIELTLDLDAFGREALEEECAHLGVSVEALASFAVLYYLADIDSGRIARALPQRPRPGEPHPLGKLLED